MRCTAGVTHIFCQIPVFQTDGLLKGTAEPPIFIGVPFFEKNKNVVHLLRIARLSSCYPFSGCSAVWGTNVLEFEWIAPRTGLQF